MADRMRWRFGDMDPAVMPVGEDTVIEIGDLVYRTTTGRIAPAAKVPAREASPIILQLFAEAFQGVAMERSRAGDTLPIRVARAGVFEFECDPATWSKGDLVGPALDVDDQSGCLVNQRVARVAEEKCAIGTVAKDLHYSAADVLVEIGCRQGRESERFLHFE